MVTQNKVSHWSIQTAGWPPRWETARGYYWEAILQMTWGNLRARGRRPKTQHRLIWTLSRRWSEICIRKHVIVDGYIQFLIISNKGTLLNLRLILSQKTSLLLLKFGAKRLQFSHFVLPCHAKIISQMSQLFPRNLKDCSTNYQTITTSLNAFQTVSNGSDIATILRFLTRSINAGNKHRNNNKIRTSCTIF